MRFVPAALAAVAVLSLGALSTSTALAADKTCEIGKRSRPVSLRPGDTAICRGESGPAGNVTVTCRFDQESPTEARSSLKFDSRNYKKVDGPQNGDVLTFHGVTSIFFRGDTQSGRDYQFIFQNTSDKTTPSVSVECHP